MATSNFKNVYRAATPDEYQAALLQLNEKINTIQKNISYLDTYNITTAVNNEEDLPAAISLLPPGEGLVVNVQYSFRHEGEIYKTGDVVLRLLSNDVIHIQSNVGGVYYPQKLEEVDGGFKITYAFSASAPPQEAATINTTESGGKTTQEVDSIGNTVTFSVDTTDISEQQVYGYLSKIQPATGGKDYHLSFPAVSTNISDSAEYVKPLVKFFLCEEPAVSGDMPKILNELSIAYKLWLDGANWKLTLWDDWDDKNTSIFNEWNIYAMVK